MRKILWSLLAVGTLVLHALPALAVDNSLPGDKAFSTHLGYSGINTQTSAMLDDMKRLGVRYIRFDLIWNTVQAGGPASYNWSMYDLVVTAITSRGMVPLALIAMAPQWANSSGNPWTPPTNPGTFGTFAGAAAARYAPMCVHHWEIWNEPNAGFWGTAQPNATQYGQMLKAAYQAIHAQDPGATVITAGLAPSASDGYHISPLDFLTQLYAGGFKPYFDAVGDHPYSFPNLPAQYATWNAWSQMSQTPTSFRGIMAANNDGAKKIWMTEYGACTAGEAGRNPVAESTQAQMATQSYQLAQAYSWAGPLFWYEYQDEGTDTNNCENFFGLVRYDGSQKPSYAAYIAVPAPNGPAPNPCGTAAPAATPTPTATPFPTVQTQDICAVPSPVIDGLLNDPAWTGPTNAFSNLVVGTSAGGASGVFQTRYDQNYFYVAVVVTDPVLYYNAANYSFDNSAVEVFFNTNYSVNNAPLTTGNLQYMVDWSGNSQTCACLFSGHGSTAGVLWGTTTTATGYNVEMAVPWSTLGKPPGAGLALGFDVEIDVNHSNPGTNGRTAQLAWSGNGNAWNDTSQFGSLTLGSACPSTPTATPSPTPTETKKVTPVSTGTPTASPTTATSVSPSVTNPISPVPTHSATVSGSPTPTFTVTPTISVTFKQSATSAVTPTVTAKSSSSATPTRTPTPSATSPSVTRTLTPSIQPSAPGTMTASPTQTASMTPSSGKTPSFTPSFPGTSPTQTATPTGLLFSAVSGTNQITQAFPVPNPNPSGIFVKLDGQADEIRARVYNPAMICVGQYEVEGDFQQGWNLVRLPTAWSSNLANGVYYMRLESARSGQSHKAGARLLIELLR